MIILKQKIKKKLIIKLFKIKYQLIQIKKKLKNNNYQNKHYNKINNQKISKMMKVFFKPLKLKDKTTKKIFLLLNSLKNL